jgi:hypothetical protein
MSTSIAESLAPNVRLLAPAALLALGILYLMGLDQGWLLSLIQGSAAYDANLLHEFVHDARHAAGFPCH